MNDIVDRLLALNHPDAADGAEEIECLRTQVQFAHEILGSESMIWVFHGSENWHQINIDHLSDPVHEYWKKYGNVFKGNLNG